MAAAISSNGLGDQVLRLRHRSGAVPAWPGCADFAQATAVLPVGAVEAAAGIRFDVLGSSGARCATPAMAVLELRVASSQLLDSEYLYLRHEVALRWPWATAAEGKHTTHWRAPFRGGTRWLAESYAAR